MGKVSRLPVQHVSSPHCEGCGKDLPTFDDAHVVIRPVKGGNAAVYSLNYVLFHVTCECGTDWLLKKVVG